MSTRPHFRQSSPRLEKKGTQPNSSIEAALKPYLVKTGPSKIKLTQNKERVIKKKPTGS